MLQGIVVSVIEWLLSKGIVAIDHALVKWMQKVKEQKALEKNQASLQSADKSGVDSDIEKAGAASLNNDSN
jgi:hypothetical protein